MSRRRKLSWEEVHATCLELCRLIQQRVSPVEAVVPVSRGGLVPASILAYELGISIPFLLDPRDRRTPPMNNTRLLVIDDVCDTGATFRGLRALHSYPRALFVAPYAKPAGVSACSVFVELVDQDKWLVFPWAPRDVAR